MLKNAVSIHRCFSTSYCNATSWEELRVQNNQRRAPEKTSNILFGTPKSSEVVERSGLTQLYNLLQIDIEKNTFIVKISFSNIFILISLASRLFKHMKLPVLICILGQCFSAATYLSFFFSDPAVHALQFLDVINMKDPSQKTNFFRNTLPEVLPYIPRVSSTGHSC